MENYVNVGMPINLETHLLIAGETGSGKSVLMNALITEIFLQDPKNRLYLFDLKMVEFSRYKKIGIPVYTDINTMYKALKALHNEMMMKYERMSAAGIVNDTKQNTYIFIDEIAEITFHENKEIAKKCISIINSFARIGRAAGYHIITATQYPTSKTVSMQLKMNCQKLCLRCNSDIGYRVMLDKKVCDLNGKGDCLYLDNYGNLSRFQVIAATESYINEFIMECMKYI